MYMWYAMDTLREEKISLNAPKGEFVISVSQISYLCQIISRVESAESVWSVWSF
jgi:hypothetical protein